VTIDQYWSWLENSFVGNIQAQKWYNGDIPQNLVGFINDKSNRLIGWATIRQLRVKSNLCSDQRIISICENSYDSSNEETQSFQPGWTNETIEEEYSSSILNAFKYSTSDELGTYTYAGQHGTYEGGGYVYEFRGPLSYMRTNLSSLNQLEWIDEHTRAVIIQLTLYNPNVQLLTSVTLLAEFLSTGGVFPSSSFQPIHFYSNSFYLYFSFYHFSKFFRGRFFVQDLREKEARIVLAEIEVLHD
jgi:hypothetical protein